MKDCIFFTGSKFIQQQGDRSLFKVSVAIVEFEMWKVTGFLLKTREFLFKIRVYVKLEMVCLMINFFCCSFL